MVNVHDGAAARGRIPCNSVLLATTFAVSSTVPCTQRIPFHGIISQPSLSFGLFFHVCERLITWSVTCNVQCATCNVYLPRLRCSLRLELSRCLANTRSLQSQFSLCVFPSLLTNQPHSKLQSRSRNRLSSSGRGRSTSNQPLVLLP